MKRAEEDGEETMSNEVNKEKGSQLTPAENLGEVEENGVKDKEDTKVTDAKAVNEEVVAEDTDTNGQDLNRDVEREELIKISETAKTEVETSIDNEDGEEGVSIPEKSEYSKLETKLMRKNHECDMLHKTVFDLSDKFFFLN